MDECEEVDGSAIVAGCEASEVFEFVEATLDEVAGFVEFDVVRDGYFARASGGNDGDHAGVGDELAEGIAVVGFVGDDAAALDAVEKRWRGDDVVDLPAGEDEAERPSEGIGEQCGFWWSILLGIAPEPDCGPPFSGRRLLVGAHQRRVEHEILVVAIGDQDLEDTLPNAALGPAREAGVDAFPLAVPLRQVMPVRAGAQHP